MSPNQQKTPPRQLRVPRPNPPSIGMEDTSHLWAVSYADFLMVLLSFFVVFFSVNKDSKNELIHSIMLGIHKNAPAEGTPGATGFGSEVGSREPSSLPAGINLTFNNTRVVTEVTKEKIVITFPDDLYNKGSVDLRGESRTVFLDLVSQLGPYSKDIIVGFVGHSDSIQVRQWPGRQITNNHDISVVRASKALALAADNGLNIENLYASGVGTELRETRSLSVIIKPRGDGLL